jgi:predicted ATPase
MNKVVISGGPYTGKTTLINAFGEVHPEFQYLLEPATVVIAEARENDILHWRSIFDSPLEFCALCMKQSLKSEQTIDNDIDFVFLDRGLVDTIAYARRDHCEELIPEVKALVVKAMYDVVLFCEPVGSINNRLEDEPMAKKTHLLLREAYEEAGIPLISIPPIDLKSRIIMIENLLGL